MNKSCKGNDLARVHLNGIISYINSRLICEQNTKIGISCKRNKQLNFNNIHLHKQKITLKVWHRTLITRCHQRQRPFIGRYSRLMQNSALLSFHCFNSFTVCNTCTKVMQHIIKLDTNINKGRRKKPIIKFTTAWRGHHPLVIIRSFNDISW